MKRFIHKIKIKTIKQVLIPVRLLTSRYRSLPDFMIIGAQKSGTSSLFKYLSKHPQVIPSIKKEIHYFDNGTHKNQGNFSKGLNWYRAHFPYKFLLKNKLTFEASPSYLFVEESLQRLKRVCPNIKLIVLLRNPVDRAVSQYYHNVRKGVEKTTLEEAMRKEEFFSINNSIRDNRLYSYKIRGHYSDQLKILFRSFTKDQVLILRSEDLFSQTSKELDKIFQFLEIDNYKLKSYKVFNRGVSVKLDANIKSFMNNYFKNENLKLCKLLNDDIWLWED